MTVTLYDLLEVSSTATQEAISVNFARLESKYVEQLDNGDEDVRNLLIALREAYATLSDPDRRKRYDLRLQVGPVEHPRANVFPLGRLLLIAVLVSLFAIWHTKNRAEQQKARLEAERIAANAKAAEIAARKEQDEQQAAQEAERLRRLSEDRASMVRERDIAYGNQISREVQRAEAQARRDEQRQELQRQREEQQRLNEANSQLARDKAYLRQLEAENRRYSRY